MGSAGPRRQLALCHWCGSQVLYPVPVAQGGQLVTSCQPCFLADALTAALRRRRRPLRDTRALQEALEAILEVVVQRPVNADPDP